MANRLRETLGERLLGLFQDVADEKWMWFEDIVTYDNARISHALILTGRWMERDDMLDAGLKTLGWLAEHQRGDGGCFRPMGPTAFWPRNGEPARFDQQPIEANAMLGACLEAHAATGDDKWQEEALVAFDWFLGGNDLGLSLYDAQTGGCRDGLHLDRTNQNEGANPPSPSCSRFPKCAGRKTLSRPCISYDHHE